MAKKSLIAREHKRKRLVAAYAARRAALKLRIVDPKIEEKERWQAQLELQRLPRNSSRVRQRSRCAITGRPRGVYKKFGLGRNKLQELAMRGEIPGLVKASW